MAGKRESRRIFDTVQILPRPREARQNASSVCQTRSCTEPRLMGQVHLNFHKVWHVTQNVDVYLLVYSFMYERNGAFRLLNCMQIT